MTVRERGGNWYGRWLGAGGGWVEIRLTAMNETQAREQVAEFRRIAMSIGAA